MPVGRRLKHVIKVCSRLYTCLCFEEKGFLGEERPFKKELG